MEHFHLSFITVLTSVKLICMEPLSGCNQACILNYRSVFFQQYPSGRGSLRLPTSPFPGLVTHYSLFTGSFCSSLAIVSYILIFNEVSVSSSSQSCEIMFILHLINLVATLNQPQLGKFPTNLTQIENTCHVIRLEISGNVFPHFHYRLLSFHQTSKLNLFIPLFRQYGSLLLSSNCRCCNTIIDKNVIIEGGCYFLHFVLLR